jgi:hypothetical protein
VIDKAAKGFVKGVAVEGPLEEYPQTYIEQLAKLKDNPDYYGPDGIDSEEAKRERLNAMAAGSVVGGTIGPVGGALEAYAPRTKNALQGLVQKPLSDPETGLPPNETDPFTSEAREYEPEAYDIGNGINARRFKIKGTETTGWAIDNPTEAVLKEFGNSGYVDDGKLILTANSAGNTLAVRGDTARAKALGKIQEDDDQEEQSKEPEKREPLDFDLSTEGEADPNADVLRDYGIKPAVASSPPQKPWGAECATKATKAHSLATERGIKFQPPTIKPSNSLRIRKSRWCRNSPQSEATAPSPRQSPLHRTQISFQTTALKGPPSLPQRQKRQPPNPPQGSQEATPGNSPNPPWPCRK